MNNKQFKCNINRALQCVYADISITTHLVCSLFFLHSLALFFVGTDYFAGAYAKFVDSQVSENLWEFVCSQSSMVYIKDAYKYQNGCFEMYKIFY